MGWSKYKKEYQIINSNLLLPLKWKVYNRCVLPVPKCMQELRSQGRTLDAENQAVCDGRDNTCNINPLIEFFHYMQPPRADSIKFHIYGFWSDLY